MKSLIKYKLYLLFIILLSPFTLNAGKPSVVPNDAGYFDLNGQIEKYEDVKGTATLKQILSDSTHFISYDRLKQPLHFNKGKNVFWIRFSLRNHFDFDKEAVLFFSVSWDKVDFFSIEKNIITHQTTGALIPINKRDFSSPYSGVNLFLKKAEEQTFYARFEYTGNHDVPSFFTRIGVIKTFYFQNQQTEKFIQGFFLGIILVMAFYNLFVFISIHDKSYIYYVMLLFAFGFIFMANCRYDFEYLWPNFPRLQQFLQEVPLYDVFCGFWILVFTQSFLNTSKNLPKLHKVINGFNAFSFLILFLSVLHIIESQTAWFVTNMLGVVFLFTSLICGILLLRKGYKAATYFLIGITFSSLGTIIFILQENFQFIPFDIKQYPMQIGNTMDMIFFSLALANRINILREENNKQKEIIIAEKLKQDQIRITSKIEAEQNERIRIAKDIHDDLGSGLSKINFLSELIITNQNQQQETAKNISETSKKLVDNMRDLIWALNPENTTLANLVARIREHSADYLEDFSAELKLNFPDTVSQSTISKEAYREIFMVFKESLNNIVKHSKASIIEIETSLYNESLAIRVKDNGIGFSSDNENIGNGLRNMQSRMEAIGGTFHMESIFNAGTHLFVTVPLYKITKA